MVESYACYVTLNIWLFYAKTHLLRKFRLPYTQFRTNTGTLLPIQIRIKDSQTNADPCGSGSPTLPANILTLLKRQKSRTRPKHTLPNSVLGQDLDWFRI